MTLRAAIVGWSLATPLGSDIETAVARLLSGERAARRNPHFPAESYGCVLAAAIPEDPPRTPHDRLLRRMGRFGYQVARNALMMSSAVPGPRLGLFSGVGGLRAHWNDILPALANQTDTFEDSWQRGLRRLHPFWMLQHLSNNAHALLSKDIDARGEGGTYGGANAGAQALSAAIWSLHANAIDAALVVAYDSLIEPETVVELTARGAATQSQLGELVAPYSARANGFVPGEAAAAAVLSRAGGHEPRASELAHLSAVTAADGSTGAPTSQTIAAALETPHGAHDDATNAAAWAVDGAALADADFDAAERAVLERLGDSPLTAMQSAMGQLGAAAPLVQAICMASCLQRGELAPIAGLEQPAPGPLTPILQARATDLRSAICLSAGAPGLAGAVRVQIPHNAIERKQP